jgi:hypothetical protein
MSIFSKIAEFLFGPTPQEPAPRETKVEVASKQPLPPGPSVPTVEPVTPIQAVEDVAAPVTKKRAPAKKKEDGWLNNEIKKPAGKKPQTPTAGKTVKKAKAK